MESSLFEKKLENHAKMKQSNNRRRTIVLVHKCNGDKQWEGSNPPAIQDKA